MAQTEHKDFKEYQDLTVHKVLQVQTVEQVHKVFKEVWGLRVLKEQLL